MSPRKNQMITNSSKKLYWLVPLSGIIMLLPDGLKDLLYLNFEQVLNGEIWRIISGHLTHLSWTHWLLNIVGLFLLQQFYGKYFTRWDQLTPPLLFAMIAISIALLTFSQELKWYGGLSGLLVSLFYFCAIKDYQHKKLFNTLALSCMSLYVLVQQMPGEIEPGLGTNIPVATRAHLYGAIAGVLWFFLMQIWYRTQKTSNSP